MAKIPFSKLQACINNNNYTIFYYNRAGEQIYYEVKQYLPLKDKIAMIERIINSSVDGNGFYSPIRVNMYMALEVIYAYTNLSFTEKQKEDPFKLYDLLISSGIFADVINCIHEQEWPGIQETVWSTIKNIYDYRNSAIGILDNIKSDYSNLNFDLDQLDSNISNPENLTLLKEIINLSGLK